MSNGIGVTVGQRPARRLGGRQAVEPGDGTLTGNVVLGVMPPDNSPETSPSRTAI